MNGFHQRMRRLVCELVDKVHQEAIDKITNLNTYSFVDFPEDYLNIPTFEDLDKERDDFCEMFNYKTCFSTPYYFYKYILDKTKNDISPISKENKIKILKKAKSDLKMKHRILVNRIKSKIEIISDSNAQLNEWQKESSAIFNKLECLIVKLDTCSHLSDEEDLYIRKIEDNRFAMQYPLKAFFEIFKNFPVTHKRKIINIASSHYLRALLKDKRNIPPALKTVQQFEEQLSRLSKFLDIEFDINRRDGHKFFYLSDKWFAETFRAPIITPIIEPILKLKKNATYKDMIAYSKLEEIEENPIVIQKLYEIGSKDIEEILDLYSNERFKIVKATGVNDDIIMCWQKLSLIRNRRLFMEIITKMIRLNEKRLKIKKEEKDPTIISILGFAVFRKQFIAATSKILHDNKDVNLEYLFEKFFLLEIDYLTAKENLMDTYIYISDNTESDLIKDIVDDVFDDRPDITDFLCDKERSIVTAYKLATDRLAANHKAISTLTSLQLIHEIMLQKTRCRVDYDTSFAVLIDLNIILEIIKAEKLISEDIRETMLVNTRYTDYISYAVWVELLSVIRNFKGNKNYPYDLLRVDYEFINLRKEETLNDQLLNHSMQLEIVKTMDLLPFYNDQCTLNSHKTVDKVVQSSYKEQRILNCKLIAAILYNNFAMDGDFNRTFSYAKFFIDSFPRSKRFASIDDDLQLTAMRVDLCYFCIIQKMFRFQNRQVSILKDGKFFDKTVNPFSRLTMEECLSMEATEQLVEIAMIRTRLMYLSRFEYSTTYKQGKSLQMLHTNTFVIHSTYIENSIADLEEIDGTPETILKFLKERENIEVCRLLLAIITRCINYVELAKNKKGNVFLKKNSVCNITDEDIQCLKNLYNSIIAPKQVNTHYSVLEKYIPSWITEMMFSFTENAKAIFQEDIKGVEDFINATIGQVKRKDNENLLLLLSTEFHAKLLRVAFFELNNGAKFGNLDKIQVLNNYTENDFIVGAAYHQTLIKMTTSKPEESEGSKIKETQLEISKFKNFLGNVIIKQQKTNLIKNFKEKNKNILSIIDIEEEFLKPDIYTKRQGTKRKCDRFIPYPNDLIRQFSNEHKYNMYRIITTLYDSIHTSLNPNKTVNLDVLNPKLMRLTNMINTEIELSNKNLQKIWPSTIAYDVQIHNKSIDLLYLLEMFQRKTNAQYEDLVSTKIAISLSPKILELNHLSDALKKAKARRKFITVTTDKEIRASYEKQLVSLKNEYSQRKNGFKNLHTKIFGSAIETVSDLIASDDHVKDVVDNHIFNNQPKDPLQSCKNEVERLRNEVKKTRIIHCLQKIGMNKLFERTKDRLLKDRQSYNQVLWHGRYRFDEDMHAINIDLDDGHNVLTQDQIKIDELQKELDVLVTDNTKLSHSCKIIERKEKGLEDEIRKYTNVEENTLAELLEKLDAAETELDELDLEVYERDRIATATIREPMEKIEMIKQQINEIRFQTSQQRPFTTPYGSQDTVLTILDTAKIENENLKSENEKLKSRIKFLEKQIGIKESIIVENVEKEAEESKIPLTVNSARRRINTKKATLQGLEYINARKPMKTAKTARYTKRRFTNTGMIVKPVSIVGKNKIK